MSGRRSQRHFGDLDRRELLAAIGVCRAACIRTATQAPIHSDVYRSADALRNAIDDLAHVLTGDRTYFHLKAHSTPHSGAP